jgi:DDE superfamily endonuclease
VHVSAAERRAGIHRGCPGHFTAHHFPLSGGPGAAREIGTGGVRAVCGRRHTGREGPVVLVDGTLAPCWSYEEHRELWNKKHKITGFNTQLISLLDGTAAWISGPLPGKTHDAKAFRETGAADILMEAGGGFGDKSYLRGRAADKVISAVQLVFSGSGRRTVAGASRLSGGLT